MVFIRSYLNCPTTSRWTWMPARYRPWREYPGLRTCSRTIASCGVLNLQEGAGTALCRDQVTTWWILPRWSPTPERTYGHGTGMVPTHSCGNLKLRDTGFAGPNMGLSDPAPGWNISSIPRVNCGKLRNYGNGRIKKRGGQMADGPRYTGLRHGFYKFHGVECCIALHFSRTWVLPGPNCSGY